MMPAKIITLNSKTKTDLRKKYKKQLKMHRNKVCHMCVRDMTIEGLKEQRVGMN